MGFATTARPRNRHEIAFVTRPTLPPGSRTCASRIGKYVTNRDTSRRRWRRWPDVPGQLLAPQVRDGGPGLPKPCGGRVSVSAIANRRRKHWGWGFADQQPDRAGLEAAAAGIREQPGFGGGGGAGAAAPRG